MFGDCKTFGKKNLLKRIFSRRKGYITIGIPLNGLDLHTEEE